MQVSSAALGVFSRLASAKGNKRLTGRALWILAIQAFFVAMLALPTTFQLQRGVALALLTGIAATLSFRVWRVHREIVFLWLATIVVGVFGITWGVSNGAPGALRVSTVYVIWPSVYLLFIGLAHDLTIMRRLETALLFGITLATVMALIVLTAGLLGFGNVVHPFFAFQGAGFGAYEGYVEFRIFNLTTVMYGFPFVLSLILVYRRELRGIRKFGIYLLLFAIVVVSLGSGRRAFWLVMLLTPFILLPFLQLSSCRLQVVPFFSLIMKSTVIAAVLIAGGIAAMGLDVIALADQFSAAFAGQEASSSARYIQAVSLWQSFTESPLVGHGLGSAVDVQRSSNMPWAYELTYLALLMNVGSIGFSIYLVAIAWVAIKGVLASRKNVEFARLFVPLITALCVFLIITATNPYLGKFDYLWVIFLPVALLNAYLTKRLKYD